MNRSQDNNSSASFYTNKVVKTRESFYGSHQATDDTTSSLIKLAANHLNEFDLGKLLDIGTGNGYVLTEIIKNLQNIKGKSLYGIDLSEKMVTEASAKCKDFPQIKIVYGDNFSLPFEDNYFDVITNKLATNFSFSEVFRVLKPGGLFIFKEYGLLKGFGGITELFTKRMKLTDPLIYIEKLRKEKPQTFSYSQFSFNKSYTREDIITIFTMAPIIRDFDPEKDMSRIDELFVNGEISVISDPFLITAVK